MQWLPHERIRQTHMWSMTLDSGKIMFQKGNGPFLYLPKV